MKNPSFWKSKSPLIITLLAILAMFPLSRTEAATFSVSYDASSSSVTSEADPYYNQESGLDNHQWDGISTIFHAPVTTSNSVNLFSSLSGRFYDSDPTRPGETGLLNRATLTGFTTPAWLVKHGLPPSSVGSQKSGTLVNGQVVEAEASYLSFSVKLAEAANGEKVQFEGANLTISGFYNMDSDQQIWAASNADNFSVPLIPTITRPDGADTDLYTFDFTGMTFVSDNFEIRVYGVLGQDQGTFGTSIVSGTFVPLDPIPEPGSLLFLGISALGLLMRRKRAANA